MNKQKEKYSSTAFLMDEALICLLNEKDYEYITVKEICKKAGVNRSTFYLHYESIDDLLEETLEYINKKFLDYFEDTSDFITNINVSSKENLYLINDKYLVPYLNYIKENKNIFLASFTRRKAMKSKERYESLEKYVLNPILDRYNVPTNMREYILSFYINGIVALIGIWIKNNCDMSVEEVINIIKICIKEG